MATCAQEERKSLDEQPLTIIVCGKVQTGKSSLINSIASKKQSPTAQTLKTESHDFEIEKSHEKSIKVKVWDTPGFGGDEQSIKDAVGSIAEKFKGADLLVYCMDMRKRRPEQDDVDAMMQLTKLLGPEVWENTVIALTFANDVEPGSENQAEIFKKHLSEWTTLINQQPFAQTLSKAISIVPTGYYKFPLPDRVDWLTPFWQNVLRNKREKSIINKKVPHKHLECTELLDGTGTKPSKTIPVFVICGKVQTGKSSLINSIAGKNCAKVAQSPLPQTQESEVFKTKVIALNTETELKKTLLGQKYSSHEVKDKVKVKVWDTPGLGDVFNDQQVLVKAVADHFRNADLLIFCIDMRTRLEEDDIQAITQLTEHCGEGLWNNAIFALTFANDLKPPPHSSEDPVEFFDRLLPNWKETIRRRLKEKAPGINVEYVPVVPIGYNDFQPPGRKDWLTNFLNVAFTKCKRSAQLRFNKEGTEFRSPNTKRKASHASK